MATLTSAKKAERIARAQPKPSALVLISTALEFANAGDSQMDTTPPGAK
jgi:hypothetical protein